MQRTMKRIGALAIVFAMLVTFMSMLGAENVNAEEEPKTIDVYMMVSNAGVIAEAKDDSAMAWKEVTVEDLDEDEKFTFHEALVAAHKKYNEEDGYAVSNGTVTKLWGVETYSTLFFINGVGLTTGVTVDEVQNGDHLTAAVLADDTYYSDWVSKFDKTAVTTKKDTNVELTLSGHLGMGYTEDEKKYVPLSDIAVGLWEEGEFKPIEGAKTDENGKVSLTFTEPGTYIVSAAGTTKGTVTDWSLFTGSKISSPPENAYLKADEDFDSSFGVGYTETDYGDGPYPIDEVKWVDWMDWYSDQESYPNLLYSNQFSNFDCPLIAPCCVVKVPADPITASLTISDKGVFAQSKQGDPMINQDVEVSDYDASGDITYDEVLYAAHEKYFEDGTDGFELTDSKYGPYVTKFWGKETSNNSFYLDDATFYTGVTETPVEDGQMLYASINRDDENYSDVFCGFDSYYRSVDPGEDVKLKLSSIYSMATVPEDLADIQIGAWVGGEFKPIEGAVTNEDGEVTLNFDESGRYIITAQGTVRGTVTYPETKEVDCPLMAPVCIVAVVPDPITVDITVNDKGELAKSKDNEAMVRKAVVVPDLNKDGEITVDEALQCAHAEYCKDGADGYATEPSKYGLKVTKLWGYKTEDTLFFIDGKGLTASVAESPLENWDDLYASVNKDDSYSSDYYTELANRIQSGCRAEKFELTLTGRQGMMGTEMKPLAGIQLGIWNPVNGFTPIEGAVTDENGEATFTLPEVGDYIITAKGTVRDVVTDWETGETKEYDCPIMAPFAFVNVYKNEAEEEACPVRQAIEALPDDDKITLDDKDAVKALIAAYDNLSANAKDYVSELDLSKLKLSNAIVDKLQLEKDKQATEAELKAANDKIAVLTVQAKLVKGVKAKGQKKKAKITWKSLGSGYTYEVYRATKLNGKFKKVKTTTSKKAVIKKLKSKKTYYVKVRAFKKVNGKKVYTNFSDTKSVKAK